MCVCGVHVHLCVYVSVYSVFAGREGRGGGYLSMFVYVNVL